MKRPGAPKPPGAFVLDEKRALEPSIPSSNQEFWAREPSNLSSNAKTKARKPLMRSSNQDFWARERLTRSSNPTRQARRRVRAAGTSPGAPTRGASTVGGRREPEDLDEIEDLDLDEDLH